MVRSSTDRIGRHFALAAACVLACAVGVVDAAEKAADPIETVEVFDFQAALKAKDGVDHQPGKSQAGVHEHTGQPLATASPTTNLTASATEPSLYSPPEFILELGPSQARPIAQVQTATPLPLPVNQISDAAPTPSDAAATEAAPAETPTEQPFLIPPAPLCENPEGRPLIGHSGESLFEPLGAIYLAGLSTAPPTTDDAEAQLVRPENDACAYLDSAVPYVYATAPQIGMVAPHRSPYPFCHNPLYYEDPNLERCGRSWGIATTAKSATLFAGQIAIWPLRAVITRPRACIKALPDCPSCHRFRWDAYCLAVRPHCCNCCR